eukprot:15329638-Ditylum_brightwellii.AAC.2
MFILAFVEHQLQNMFFRVCARSASYILKEALGLAMEWMVKSKVRRMESPFKELKCLYVRQPGVWGIVSVGLYILQVTYTIVQNSQLTERGG